MQPIAIKWSRALPSSPPRPILVNDVKHVILGLKSLEQYDIESCYASLTVQRLPKPIRELWQTEHKNTRHVVPISKLLIFLEERAAAAGAAMAIPSLYQLNLASSKRRSQTSQSSQLIGIHATRQQFMWQNHYLLLSTTVHFANLKSMPSIIVPILTTWTSRPGESTLKITNCVLIVSFQVIRTQNAGILEPADCVPPNTILLSTRQTRVQTPEPRPTLPPPPNLQTS